MMKGDEGSLTLDSEDHGVQIPFNRITIPRNEGETNGNKMTGNVQGVAGRNNLQ